MPINMTRLIGSDNSVILSNWREHDDETLILNSYRNIKRAVAKQLFSILFFLLCFCTFTRNSSFPVEFLSNHVFPFILPPPPALSSLLHQTSSLSISVQVAFGEVYSRPVTSQHALPLTRTLTSCFFFDISLLLLCVTTGQVKNEVLVCLAPQSCLKMVYQR